VQEPLPVSCLNSPVLRLWELRMGRNWIPSILPKSDDQTVYLAVNDFGRNGRAYREADVETADLETVIVDLLDGQYNILSASSPSTPPKSGRRMSQRISPKSCAAAAICNRATRHQMFRISSSGMKVETGNLLCGLPDQ
jgi:hypothetical protein